MASSRARALVCWSSGKDSAWALHTLRTQGNIEVAGLLTTISGGSGRVVMHDVRTELLEAQARSVGLPLITVPIPSPCTNAQYEAAMAGAVARARADDITVMAFGDLFLEDIRRYREEQLAPTGMRPIFPLWGQPTGILAQEMVTAGLRATVTCLDPARLPPAFAGRTFDHAFLADLPDGVDPCGEYGEFHTFAFQGPMFQAPIGQTLGAVVERDSFVFADLLPPQESTPRQVHEPGVGTLDLWALPPHEPLLFRLLSDLFQNHWQEITFGPLLQGSAWEISPHAPPERVVLHDGYLTVDFGRLHFHLCIGEHHGEPDAPTPLALAHQRRTARAELFRRINRDGAPDTWGLRLFNGGGEQQLTVLLPNPFLTAALQFRDTPDWSRLHLWDTLRQEYLDLGPDDFDRSGHRMIYP